MSSIVPSYLQPFTYNLYGVGTSTQSDVTQGNSLYQKFLNLNSLDSSTVAAATGAAQIAYEAKYTAFLQEQLTEAYNAQSILNLSPDEVQKRDIMFKTFSLVLDMLNTLQQTMRNVSNALVLYQKWQAQYTNEMTSVPLYQANASAYMVANLQDFGKTTLGYGSTTVANAVTSLLFNPAAEAGGKSSVIDLAYQGTGGLALFNTSAFTFEASSLNGKVAFLVNDRATGVTIYSSGLITLPTLQSDATSVVPTILSNLTYQFQNFTGPIPGLEPLTYNTVKQHLLAGDLYWGTPWSAIVGVSGQNPPTDADKFNTSRRGEVNAVLQRDIQSVQSLRQQVSDRTQPLQNLLDDTRQTMQDQANLLSSIVDSMKGLITAIFR